MLYLSHMQYDIAIHLLGPYFDCHIQSATFKNILQGDDTVDGRNDGIIADYHATVRRLYAHALAAHNSIHFAVSFLLFLMELCV